MKTCKYCKHEHEQEDEVISYECPNCKGILSTDSRLKAWSDWYFGPKMIVVDKQSETLNKT